MSSRPSDLAGLAARASWTQADDDAAAAVEALDAALASAPSQRPQAGYSPIVDELLRRVAALEERVRELEERHPRHSPPPGLRR